MRARWEQFGARLLGALADAIIRRPRWFYYPQLALFGLCVWYTVASPWKLGFDTNRSNLVGGDKRYNQNLQRFRKEFPLPDDLVVVVESENREKNRQFVERLGARLEAETNVFLDVVFKGDLKMLGAKALLFLPEDKLAEMRQTLADYRPFLEKFSRAHNLVTLFDLVNDQIRNSSREENAGTSALVKALPALERILTQASDSLQRQGTPPSPGITALFGGGPEAESQMYITFPKAPNIYLVTTRALHGDRNAEAVARLRELVSEIQLEVPGLNVGVTGEPVLEIDEMAQSQSDTTKATVLSFLLVALMFVLGYHETGRPLKATLALVIGLGYTMAFTTAVVGHLNILTVTFAPILVGLAIDFGVHLISRYEEEVRHGASNEEGLRRALVFTGMGVVTGALTTAGAFLAMGATSFRGIQEMGLICGGGLAICLIPMMTILPALLLRGRQNVIDHALGAKLDRREKIEKLWLARPRKVVAITVAVCVAALIPARKVYFDYNLMEMQSKALPSVIFSQKLIHSANKSVLYGAIIATNLAQAVELEGRLKKLPSVASVDLAGIDNMARYLTEDQSRKLALVARVKEEVSGIRIPVPDPAPADLRQLQQTLFSFHGYMALILAELPRDRADLRRQVEALQRAVADLNLRLRTARPEAAAKLAAFQQALFSDIRDTFETLRHQDDRSRLTVGDLPETVRKRFVGLTGAYLVQVYPKEDVWKREHQKVFVAELRTVDPDVTGSPVQLLEYTSLLKSSYQEAAGYALVAIALLILIHFRRLDCVFLALLPVTLGALWMVAFMGLFGVPFNPANIMTLPLLIGVGVTNGIHILNRFSEEQRPGILARSTGKAVLVSGLTTIAGFGSLMIAQHQGISSLGFVMGVGTATCMLAGITVLPAVLHLLGERGWTIKKPSGDNAQSAAGSGGTEVKTSTVTHHQPPT